VNEFEVTVGDLKQLTSVIRSIEKLEGVQTVQRA
jgi:GTP pyrophosphokinase